MPEAARTSRFDNPWANRGKNNFCGQNVTSPESADSAPAKRASQAQRHGDLGRGAIPASPGKPDRYSCWADRQNVSSIRKKSSSRFSAERALPAQLQARILRAVRAKAFAQCGRLLP